MQEQIAYRAKAIAAAAGLVGTALLECASSSPEVAGALEQVVPAAFVPLVPILLGGIATVVAVHRVPNRALQSVPVDTLPEPAPRVIEAPVLEQAAPVASPPATLVATGAAPEPAPFWAAVPAGAPTTSTSIVRLPDIPVTSYQ